MPSMIVRKRFCRLVPLVFASLFLRKRFRIEDHVQQIRVPISPAGKSSSRGTWTPLDLRLTGLRAEYGRFRQPRQSGADSRGVFRQGRTCHFGRQDDPQHAATVPSNAEKLGKNPQAVDGPFNTDLQRVRAVAPPPEPPCRSLPVSGYANALPPCQLMRVCAVQSGHRGGRSCVTRAGAVEA